MEGTDGGLHPAVDGRSLGEKVKEKSTRQRTMEGIDGGLHPAVDGQSLGEARRRWKSLLKYSQYHLTDLDLYSRSECYQKVEISQIIL